MTRKLISIEFAPKISEREREKVSVSRSTKVYASYMITILSENQCMTRKLFSIEFAPKISVQNHGPQFAILLLRRIPPLTSLMIENAIYDVG